MATRGDRFQEEQEVLALIADVLSDVYLGESVVLRPRRRARARRSRRSCTKPRPVCSSAMRRTRPGEGPAGARGSCEGDTLRTHVAALTGAETGTGEYDRLEAGAGEATVAKGGYVFR